MSSYTGKNQSQITAQSRKVIELRLEQGQKADLVLKNATYVGVFSGELRNADVRLRVVDSWN